MSSPRTYFQVFDLPQRFALDRGDLEARYREASMRWHPDRHAQRAEDAALRSKVLLRATEINEAYRVLRDERRRAEYLLSLHGIDVGAEGGQERHQVDPAFLQEILELREALAEARSEGDDARIEEMDKEMRARTRKEIEHVAEGFARLESGEGGRERALSAITRALLHLRYYDRFHEEIEAYREARGQ